MVKTLERPIAEVTSLSDSDQDEIGQKLLSHVERFLHLRINLDKGIRSLDAGKGQELNVEQFLAEARTRHCRS